MSQDRGAFGELMAKVKRHGFAELDFHCDLARADDDLGRWTCSATKPFDGYQAHVSTAGGRTGEEALRRLVERIEGT